MSLPTKQTPDDTLLFALLRSAPFCDQLSRNWQLAVLSQPVVSQVMLAVRLVPAAPQRTGERPLRRVLLPPVSGHAVGCVCAPVQPATTDDIASPCRHRFYR
jgi:hypothetical protein